MSIYLGQNIIPFIQPILSSNGTVGNNTFSVKASSENQSGSDPYKAYEAFDNNASTYWRSDVNFNNWLEFYNPNPLNVTNLKWGFFYSYPTGGNVQASDDESNWITLTNWTNNIEADFNIDLSSNTSFYKYYRININGVNKDRIHCKSLIITARENKSIFASKVYIGNTKIAKIYRGSTLLYQAIKGVPI